MQMKRMGGVGLFAKSCLTLCDPWTVVAHQASRSMGFSRQEYRGGLPFPSRGDLPHPGIDAVSLLSPELASGFLPRGPLEAHVFTHLWSTDCQQDATLQCMESRRVGHG